MPGQNPQLSPRESRKRLLVAESELSRAQILGDLATFKASLGHLGRRAKSYRTLASAAALLVMALAARGRGKPTDLAPKRPWLAALGKGAGLVASLWLAFRTERRSPPADR